MFSARFLAIFAGVVVVALLAGSLLNTSLGNLGRDPKAAPPPDPSVAKVTKVIDGDTIQVRFVSGAVRSIRYIGLDAPETKPTPECDAREATNYNADLVEGESVRVLFDRERHDIYGRLLAYVYRARDNKFVNAAMLGAGLATPLTIPPNTHFADQFRSLAKRARTKGIGLWGTCDAPNAR